MKSFLCAALSILLSSIVMAAENPAGTGPGFKGPSGFADVFAAILFTQRPAREARQGPRIWPHHHRRRRAARGMSLEDFFKELDKRGIKLVSTGVNFAQLKSNPDAPSSRPKNSA
jgi:hypothetical protein